MEAARHCVNVLNCRLGNQVTSSYEDIEVQPWYDPRSLPTFSTFRQPFTRQNDDSNTEMTGESETSFINVIKPSEESSLDSGIVNENSDSDCKSPSPNGDSSSGTNDGDSVDHVATPKQESNGSDFLLAEEIGEDGGVAVVKMLLERSERRFGFSVVGGCDEGFQPRIESITPGSPADRADLEVGDEILEVNGRSLDNCTHTEVISHIHQCIRSRTICLRVKRKTSSKLALDLSRNSHVQDAFVIAVEQQARERLEKLSALKKIKPVDMTKLSQELNECSQGKPELNGVIENNPIYMTTVPEIHNATLERIKKDQLRCTNGQVGNVPIHEMSSKDQSQTTGDQELELMQEILDNQGCADDQSLSSPETPPRERLLVENQPCSDLEHFSQNCVSIETLLPTNIPDKSKVSTPTTCVGEKTDRNRCSEREVGKHREMAVDVPDSFVGVSKTAPRYPPPKSAENTCDQHRGKRNSPNASADILSKSKKDLVYNSINKHHNNINAKTKPALDANGAPPCDKTVSKEEMERLRKYQDEIRRRREAEEKLAKENEFLRNSLRGSKKLQALEDSPLPPSPKGEVNTAFEDELHRPCETAKLEDGEKEIPELLQTYGVSDLLQSLYRIKLSLRGNGPKDSELLLLEGLIRSKDFQNILAVHNKVQEVCCFQCPPSPVCFDAEDVVQEVMSILQDSCTIPEAVELLDLLSRYEVEGLIYSHDKIAERQSVPAITPDEELLDRASHYTDGSVKIVRIDKTNEPLGATVRNEGDALVIGRIVKGGAAEKSGLLHEGDEILEVNGVEMRGKSVNDICDILATMAGTLTFLIVPAQYEPTKNVQREIMHVKAHFDYDPDDDLYIPCRELGISFQKGDILHVINQRDPNWWQAHREGEEDQALAGLIPSKNFQQQRESMKQAIVKEASNKEKSKKGKFLCAKKYHKKKKKKMMYSVSTSDDLDGDSILTYEEVALYYPRANCKRPIVLIGPPNIGRHEVRQRLMEDTERFSAAVPHTSRSKRDAEVDGVDYHFITRSQFEADIMGGKFVEHGEYEKNYYGTSLDAIRAVVNSGKICVLNLHPQSLKILKNSDLKPYVVFVAPPSLEKLRQNRMKSGDYVKDDELKEIIEKAREMEENYGHFFDMVVINSDIDKAYNELLKEINTLEREPQWVPAAWLRNELN